MSPERFEDANAKRFQQRVADIEIGTSVARNQGFAGAVDTARSFLATMDLRQFGLQRTESEFLRLLDKRTLELQQRLKGRRKKQVAVKPTAPALWGTARKVLNVFLCEAYFHRVLQRCYGLQNLMVWLEVPLDSIISKAIKEKTSERKLRLPFPGVGRLDEMTSRRFQEQAKRIAENDQLPARIYFEVREWRRKPARSEGS